MKKLVSVAVLLMLLTVSLFAGSFSVESNTSYILPVFGWDFGSGNNNEVSKVFYPGFLEEVEVSYAFNDYARLGVSAGFGINELELNGNVRPYNIPVLINGTFSTPAIDKLKFFAKVGVGGFVKIDMSGKNINLGPAAQAALGAEVNIVKGLYLGITTKLLAELEITKTSTALQLDYAPFSINVRYEF